MSSSTVAETVYNEIRDDILYGELQPGVKLKLDALRERYSAGVNTLREVLNRLVASGFVFVEGQKGFRVVETSPSNLNAKVWPPRSNKGMSSGKPALPVPITSSRRLKSRCFPKKAVNLRSAGASMTASFIRR